MARRREGLGLGGSCGCIFEVREAVFRNLDFSRNFLPGRKRGAVSCDGGGEGGRAPSLCAFMSLKRLRGHIAAKTH